MQVSVEATDSIVRRMTVELPEDKVSDAFESKLKEISRTVRIDGFRQGKVPLRIIKQRYGAGIRGDIINDMVRDSFYDALTQEKLIPVGEPNIEPVKKDKGNGVAYVATFDVMPEVKIGDLSGVSITKDVAVVTDADVDDMILKLRKQQVTWNDVDRTSQDEDQLTISFKGYVDDEAFVGGEASDVPLVLGSGSMIDGFEAGLVGKSAGDSVTLNVTFPEKYQSEALAGKDARFEVDVIKVSEAVLPEVDDEFATTYGVKEGGVASLHAEIRGNMERELKEKLNATVKTQAMDALAEAHEISIPNAMIQDEAKALMEQTKQNMQSSGQAAPGFDLPVNLFEAQAEKRVKLGLLINQIVRDNDMQINEEKVVERIAQFAESYEDTDAVMAHYAENKEARESIENVILESQVVDWVVEQGTVTEQETSFDAVMNPATETDK